MQLLERTALPAGAIQVGAGLLVSGAVTYVFLIGAARQLGPTEYAPLTVLWTMVFLTATGFFLPIEQEISRAVSGRRSVGADDRLVLRRGWLLTLAVGALTLAVGLAAAIPLRERLLDSDASLLIGFGLALAGYAVTHLIRGVLAGRHDFMSYGMFTAADSVIRLVLLLGLIAVGTTAVGPIGIALGASPIIVVAAYAAIRGRHLAPTTPQPGEPEWRDLTASMGGLVAASLFSQMLAYVGPLAIRLLEQEGQSEEASRFFSGLVMTRVPLFLFQAIQAPLLPLLAALVARGHYDALRSTMAKLVGQLMSVVAVIIAGAALVGPDVQALLFGEEFRLDRLDLVLLASATGMHLLALALAQALIAMASPVRMAAGWLLGLAVFPVIVALEDDLLLRVELGLVAAEAATVLVMIAATLTALGRARRYHPVTEVS